MTEYFYSIKDSLEPIGYISAADITAAKSFFAATKNLPILEFDKIYDVHER